MTGDGHLAGARAVLLAMDEAELINALAALCETVAVTKLLDDEIRTGVQARMSSNTREYQLRQQLQYIREQLGDTADDGEQVVKQLREQLATAHTWPDEAAQIAKTRLSALARMSPSSSEFQNTTKQLTWLAAVPWNKTTVPALEEAHVLRDLDERHFGAQPVKDWVLEQVAVMRLTQKRPPVLCLVGPPGVGKTSLAQGIAAALRRRLAMVPLAGINDGRLLRGSHPVYVGAEPGQIIKAAIRVGTLAPVFLLDEADRLKESFANDAAIALAQMLDQARQGEYRDDYLEVPVDLSRAMFIATATQESDIHPTLRSRMEILKMWGYSPAEKFEIARNHLGPDTIASHGLSGRIVIDDGALRHIITRYTTGPGVRDLASALAKICRRSAKQAAGKVDPILISKELVHSFLGPAPMRARETSEALPGVIATTTLNRLGASVWPVRCLVMPGTGKITLTGNVADYMKELTTVAITLLRARDAKTQDGRALLQCDLHVQLDGDGSGPGGTGAAILIALASAICEKAPKHATLALGTIDLTGQLCGIDDLYPQVLAAQAAGIKEIVLSELHREDIDQLPTRMRTGNTLFSYVRTVDRMLELVGIKLG